MTFAQALREGGRRLTAAGRDHAREDARALLIEASNLTPVDLIRREDDPVCQADLVLYDALLTKRAQAEPMQHILGRTHFHGLELKCDTRALIPRDDSECVVDLALEYLPPASTALIADLGTGSGALLAALLTKRPSVRGVGVERSLEAVKLARENIDALNLSARTQIEAVSWTQWTGWSDAELVISNPPYIASAVIETLDPEVRKFDPRAALDGGADGLDAYRDIIELGATKLKRGAHLVLEIGYDQKPSVMALLQAAGFAEIVWRKDLGGHDRAVAARLT